MAKRFYDESEIRSWAEPNRVMPKEAYDARSPIPQVFVVANDDRGCEIIRTLTMGPLSWVPYTKTVNVPLEDRNSCGTIAGAGR